MRSQNALTSGSGYERKFAASAPPAISVPQQRVRDDAGTELAKQTRDFVMATVGNYVQLTNVTVGKYAGPIIADAVPVDGRSPGPLWIAASPRKVGWVERIIIIHIIRDFLLLS